VTVTVGSKINSIQNGFLLRKDVHALFDRFLISINPDDGYKIVVFDPDIYGHDGRVLDPVCRNPANPDHVADGVLRWHYRQSVLANVRGGTDPHAPPPIETSDDMLHPPWNLIILAKESSPPRSFHTP